jgi:hypothetical protein
MSSDPAQDILREFAGVRLRDGRLRARIPQLGALLAKSPAKSFPKALGQGATLKALYRVLGNTQVTPGVLMEPHHQQTVARAGAHPLVLVVHDTTALIFPGDSQREGLGFINGSSDQGFLLHCSLALSADGRRRPLGVVATKTWVRSKRSSRRADGRPRDGGDYHREGTNEGDRWSTQCDAADVALGGVEAIHVSDREADAYEHFRAHREKGRRFIVRMTHDRALNDEFGDRDGKTSDALVHFPELARFEAPVSARRASSMPRAAKARGARVATLAVAAGTIRLRRPNYIRDGDEDLEVNVVTVTEVDAPSGAEPITWVLLTSERVHTYADALQIIEFYRTRWLIEEFFKALKTGCSVEKRQLESYDALTKMLAFFLPIAWQMLLLRSLERTEGKADAAEVLTTMQIRILRMKLPKLPLVTVTDALRAVAHLGGHYIKKPPGWLVIGRGMEDLLLLEAGFLLALEARTTGNH